MKTITAYNTKLKNHCILLGILVFLVQGCSQNPIVIEKTPLPDGDYGFVAFRFDAEYSGLRSGDVEDLSVVIKNPNKMLGTSIELSETDELHIVVLPAAEYYLSDRFWQQDFRYVLSDEPKPFHLEPRQIIYLGSYSMEMHIADSWLWRKLDWFDYRHYNDTSTARAKIRDRLREVYGRAFDDFQIEYRYPFEDQ